MTQGTYAKPVGGDNAKVTSSYGIRDSGTHKGIDIIDDTGSGSDILSIADGKVLSSYYSDTFGNTVIVYHEDLSTDDEAIVSVYGHMETRLVDNSEIPYQKVISSELWAILELLAEDFIFTWK